MTGEKKETRGKKNEKASIHSGPGKTEGDTERYPEDEIIEALRQEGEGAKEMEDLYREVDGKSGASRARRPPSKRDSAKRGE